ncbi:MAG: tetratricopeptide repeat protein, partial [Acidobacteriota bacterium]|nr:tetratricopeptide repeat protein [Acidobacteriota bacterium]
MASKPSRFALTAWEQHLLDPIPRRPGTPHLISYTLLALPMLLILAVVTAAAQNDKNITALQPGKPVERELAGDQAHAHSIALTVGQYLRVVVDQRGIDVVVTIFSPDGQPLLEVDSPNGKAGLESVSIIAGTTGRYRLNVRSLEKTATAGRYEVRIEEIRAATEKDRSLTAAEQLFQAGRQLRNQGTKESLAAAILKFKEAQPLYHALGDAAAEALILFNIGFVDYALGEPRQALVHFNRALPLTRAVGDRNTEAGTLNNIGAACSALGEKQKALDYYAQALPVCRAVGNRKCEGVALDGIGQVYKDLGEKQKALEHFGQALSLRRAAGDRKGEAGTLNNIGTVYG